MAYRDPYTGRFAPSPGEWYIPDQSYAARRIASQNHVHAPVRDILRDARERMSAEGKSHELRTIRHELYRQVLSAQHDAAREFAYWRF